MLDIYEDEVLQNVRVVTARQIASVIKRDFLTVEGVICDRETMRPASVVDVCERILREFAESESRHEADD
jgi:hypothetical protein